MATRRQPIETGNAQSQTADLFALVKLYFQTAWNRYSEFPLMLANLQAGTPLRTGLASQPGATDQEKVDWALDYLEEAAALGASAFDATCHDSGLMRSHPAGCKSPRDAAHRAFRNGGRLYLVQRTLDNEAEADPEWDFYAAPQYATFWKRYGMP